MTRQLWQCASGRTMHLAALVALVIAVQASSRAHAQSYKTLKPALAPAAAQQLRGKVGAVLRDPTPPTPADLKVVEQFFNGYVFPMMTSDTPAQLGALAKTRKDLFVQYINAAKTPQARTHLLALTMKACGPISAGAYHPAVRYNAALILGQLDETPATGGNPPKPLPAGTNALTALLERPEINKVPVPASVKIAALVGLERHTRMGADPQYSERITAAALALANRKDAPEDVSADVNGWMRRLAAQVLANQFAAGFTAPVHQAFVALIGDKDLSLDDRCEVARLLKPTMYKTAQGVDAGEMADALGRLAKDIFAAERKKAEEYQEELLNDPSAGMSFGGGGFGGGRGGGFGGGRGGGFGGMPGEPQGPHFEKRRTLDRVVALTAGASAISDGGSDDVKQRMTALIAPLKEAADFMADDNSTDVAISEAVVDLAKQINDIVNSWTAGAAPAADAPADDGKAGEFGEGAN